MKLILGRRYAVTGPFESAELGGLDIIHRFARFLFPALENFTEPSQADADLAKNGRFGLKTGKGTWGGSERGGQALLKARADSFFQRLAQDSKSSVVFDVSSARSPRKLQVTWTGAQGYCAIAGGECACGLNSAKNEGRL